MKISIIDNCDVLIIGAGPVGCVLAERFSSITNLKCLIVDKRNHIAGNCYDKINSKGLLYHKYGPHYLRFKNKNIYKYLSKFTQWIDGKYIVKSIVNKKQYPFPINIKTLELFFNKKFKSKKDLINFIDKKKINIKKPKNSEEFILSRLGREIYEAFYKNYTIKQWGLHPAKLPKEIVGRVPIRFNKDDRYVNEKIQVMPKKGFTSMFKNMINNKNITVSLNTDFKKIKNLVKPKLFTIYTGCPDEYFDYKFGKLDWRSLKFSFKNYKKKYLQDCVQYNFPNEKNYTRSVEIKHVTKQRSNFTVISREYPTSKGDPYYPINTKDNIDKFNKYKKLILKEEKKKVFFEGRLATYRYLNTDQVIERALLLYKKLKKILDDLK
jgi:UDP-galactopyranose mutase